MDELEAEPASGRSDSDSSEGEAREKLFVSNETREVRGKARSESASSNAMNPLESFLRTLMMHT